MSKKGVPKMPTLEPSDIHVGDVIMVRMCLHRYWPRVDAASARDATSSHTEASTSSPSKSSPSTPTKSTRSQDSRVVRPWVADFYLKSVFLLHCAGDNAKEEEKMEYDFTRLFDEVFEEAEQPDGEVDAVSEHEDDGELWVV